MGDVTGFMKFDRVDFDKQKVDDLLKQKVKGLVVIGQVLKSNPIEPSVTVVTDKGSVYLPSKSSWQHFEE